MDYLYEVGGLFEAWIWITSLSQTGFLRGAWTIWIAVGTWISHMYVCTCSELSCVQLSVTPWTVACQAPLSTKFSRQEYWSKLPCPPPGDLPHPGIEPESLTSPTLAGGFFTTGATWEASPVNEHSCVLITFDLYKCWQAGFSAWVMICWPLLYPKVG